MKFYAEPGLLVRPRKNGVMKRFRPFRFDNNGEYETDNPILVKALKQRFSTDVNDVSQKNNEDVIELIDDELTEESIRQLAKDRKIKSWHVKSIETLKEELGV